jgi:hypothetical protein
MYNTDNTDNTDNTGNYEGEVTGIQLIYDTILTVSW